MSHEDAGPAPGYDEDEPPHDAKSVPVLPEDADLVETIGAETRPALLRYARSIAPGDTPTHRSVGLVLMGLLAGLDVDIRRSIDDYDPVDGAVTVATDLVRKLEAGGAERAATETNRSGSQMAVPVPRSTDESVPDRQTGWHSLTETERTVARLIAEGLTNEQAARKLGRSKHTIGTHLRSAFVKMQVQSRVQLRNAMAGREDRHKGHEPTAFTAVDDAGR